MSKKNKISSNFSNPTRLIVKEETVMDNQDQNTQETSQDQLSENIVNEVTEVVLTTEETITPHVEVVEHTKEETVKVNEPVIVKQQVTKPAPNSKVDIVIEEARNGTNQFNKTVVSFLDKYNESMAPGVPVNPKEGGNHQHTLYSVINQIINQSTYDSFKSAFGLLIAYMVKHQDGLFGEKYVFRFAEEWPSGADRLTNFHAMLNLLKIISNPSERPVGKFVSLERTFNTGFSETAKDNIMRFISK